MCTEEFLKLWRKYSLAIKSFLCLILFTYFVFLNWPDGILCREITCILYGDIDRHELLNIFNNIELGSTEGQFLATYRKIAPKYLDLVPSRAGYVIYERRDILYTFWKMEICVDGGMLVSAGIRDVDNNIRPNNAPNDKNL